MNEQLEQLRDAVEGLSIEILSTLSQRADKALDIAREKKKLGLPIRDPYREDQLLARLVRQNQGPLDDATVRSLFRSILDASVSLMEGKRRAELRVGAAGGPPVLVTVAGHTIGNGTPQYIAGPCSVENEDQMEESARGLARLGVRFLRGGAFKPRTSPYAFQGLGKQGLVLLRDAARRYGMASVTEATSPDNVELVAEYADMIQIGSRNMSNFELLRAAGQTGRPIVLKRGFAATLDEWVNAAEYVALSGSEDIILCERGIRTYARETRNTLDVSAIPLARARTRLPVMADVSHAAGRRDILAPLTSSAFACGAQAVMVEVHPDPDVALSDAEQQLTLDDFAALQRTVANTLARTAAALLDATDGAAEAASLFTNIPQEAHSATQRGMQL